MEYNSPWLIAIVPLIVYGILFGGREEKIRSYIRSQSRGWIRWLYVRAFIGAVRGQAAATETRLLTFISLSIVFFAASFLFYENIYVKKITESIASDFEILQSTFKNTEESKNSQNKHEKKQVDSTNKKTDNLKNLLENKEKAVNELKEQTDNFRLHNKIVYIILIIAFYIGISIWRPFLVMRRLFAHELDRFTLRIQGLATKQELAKLAVAEAKVTDEDTLRQFVEVTREVAERHAISSLARTFDLWS